jgi:hypothetical protein
MNGLARGFHEIRATHSISLLLRGVIEHASTSVPGLVMNLRAAIIISVPHTGHRESKLLDESGIRLTLFHGRIRTEHITAFRHLVLSSLAGS